MIIFVTVVVDPEEFDGWLCWMNLLQPMVAIDVVDVDGAIPKKRRRRPRLLQQSTHDTFQFGLVRQRPLLIGVGVVVVWEVVAEHPNV